MKKVEIQHAFNGYELILVADDHFGTNLEVYLYTGSITTDDHIRITPMPHVLEKFRESFIDAFQPDGMALAKAQKELEMEEGA